MFKEIRYAHLPEDDTAVSLTTLHKAKLTRSSPTPYVISLATKTFSSIPCQNLKAVYDKHGKKMTEKEGIKMEDAAGFFANMFGGDRFVDYVHSSLLFNLLLL